MLEEAIDGRIELVVPPIILSELEDVLIRKLGFDRDATRDARRLLERLAAVDLAQPQRAEAVTGDPADDLVLACAVKSRADVLATGDRRHLLPLGSYRGVRLLTPQALLAELRAAGP